MYCIICVVLFENFLSI